jgi:hypothetical protein
MQIAFDNTRRLQRKHYLFEYRGVRFKLVQDNPRKWADHLLTIVPQDDRIAREHAFSVASEFLSALAWENGAGVAVWEAGGSGWPDNLPLRRAQPNIFVFPRIPFRGNAVGHTPSQIPQIQNEAQRIALALFREARASNNDYLSFLFFWQVLEVDGRSPEDFVNKAFRKHRDRLRIDQSCINQLPLDGRTLGRYLLDDCRNAIAHIRRKPGKKKIDLDKPGERMRLAISAQAVKAFAEHYIKDVLGLTEHMYLVRPRRGGFPSFVDYQTFLHGAFRPAYPSRPLRIVGSAKGGRQQGK